MAFSKANFLGDDIYAADAISAHRFQPKPEPVEVPKKAEKLHYNHYVDFFVQPSKLLDDRMPDGLNLTRIAMAKKPIQRPIAYADI